MLKIKLLSISLFTIFFMSYSQNDLLDQKGYIGRILDFFASSKMMYLAGNYIQKPIGNQMHKLCPKIFQLIENGLASEEYQQLAKEAQDTFKIPLDRQVPVKKISPESKFYYNSAFAMAEPEAIYVNERFLNISPYGVKRCTLFHEVVHKKYNDGISHTLYKLLAATCSAIAFNKASTMLAMPSFLRKTSVIIVGIAVFALAAFKSTCYFEHRADIEGCYATECFRCIDELAQTRENLDKAGLKLFFGYASIEELRKIVSDLKEQNKICAYHSKV